MDCGPPGSSVHGILQARTLVWVAIPVSRGDLPDPGMEPVYPTLQAEPLPTESLGKASTVCRVCVSNRTMARCLDCGVFSSEVVMISPHLNGGQIK